MAANQTDELPSLYLIADVATAEKTGVDLTGVVSQFVAAGGRMVSLRPSAGADRDLIEMGKVLSGLVFAAGGTFLVHRRADVARLVGAHGVHAPGRGFSAGQVSNVMGTKHLVYGRSCHHRADVNDVDRTALSDSTFATLGPLFESVSKSGYGPEISPGQFRDIARDADIPIYALGGVLPDNVGDCFDAGARGVAVVGGILGAESVAEATTAYLEAIRRAEAV